MYAIEKSMDLCRWCYRDRLGLLKVGVPVFARGIDPKLWCNRREPLMFPYSAGVFVKPGDIIVGDEDGSWLCQRMMLKELLG